MAEETEKVERVEPASDVDEEELEPDKSRAGRIRLREIFRQAFDKARREQQPVASRREPDGVSHGVRRRDVTITSLVRKARSSAASSS